MTKKPFRPSAAPSSPFWDNRFPTVQRPTEKTFIHFYAAKGAVRTACLGLGADLVPGLHNADMRFNLGVLPFGAKILAHFAASKQGVCQ